MASTATNASVLVAPPKSASALDQKLAKPKSPIGRWGVAAFILVVVGSLSYIAAKLASDLSVVHSTSVFAYVLLGIALLLALGFEFVNGFHDTANAVATVIYTHSLEPRIAVIWSGIWNFIGVLTSSGAVAFTMIALLPHELTLKVSRGSGFSMIFALLIAAILWNLVTWHRGLPISSSHTMIGSVLGVGIAYQLVNGHSALSGINMAEVIKVFKALLFSPLIGFAGAVLLYFLFKALLRDPRLFKAPEGTQPPPFSIRLLMILTCTGVSFAHGQNDGQKGMGLIMLILIGTVPTAYALNHAIDKGSVQPFAVTSTQVAGSLQHYAQPNITVAQSEPVLEHFLATHKYEPQTTPALQEMITTLSNEAISYGSLGNVPPEMQANIRNQMYLVSESLSLLAKTGPQMAPADLKIIASYKSFLDRSIKYIPTWVKVAVALALGLGTMVGWKRIVVTVGEKIGKTHMTYAQGAVAGLTAMGTILAAGMYGLPVSTTHVLNSGVAGTMVANGSGIQRSTIRNIILAWFFTLPAAALLSGCLFFLFNKIVS